MVRRVKDVIAWLVVVATGLSILGLVSYFLYLLSSNLQVVLVVLSTVALFLLIKLIGWSFNRVSYRMNKWVANEWEQNR